MDGLLVAGFLIAGCGLLFAASLGIGILVGRRLDRAVEARAAGDGQERRQEVRSHE